MEGNMFPSGGVGRGKPLNGSKPPQSPGIYGVDTDYAQKRHKGTKVTFKCDNPTDQQVAHDVGENKIERLRVGRTKEDFGSDGQKYGGEKGRDERSGYGKRRDRYEKHKEGYNVRYDRRDGVDQEIRSGQTENRQHSHGRYRGNRRDGNNQEMRSGSKEIRQYGYDGYRGSRRDENNQKMRSGPNENRQRGYDGYRGNRQPIYAGYKHVLDQMQYSSTESLGHGAEKIRDEGAVTFGGRVRRYTDKDVRNVDNENRRGTRDYGRAQRGGRFGDWERGQSYGGGMLSSNPSFMRSGGQSNEQTVDSRMCFNCRQIGHLSRDCTEEPKPRKPIECYGCHEIGHLMRDCPNKRGPEISEDFQAVSINRLAQETCQNVDNGLLGSNGGMACGYDERMSYTMNKYMEDLSYPGGQSTLFSTAVSPYNLDEFPALISTDEPIEGSVYGVIGSEAKLLTSKMSDSPDVIIEAAVQFDTEIEPTKDADVDVQMGMMDFVYVDANYPNGDTPSESSPETAVELEVPSVTVIEEATEIDQGPILSHQLIWVDQVFKTDDLRDILRRPEHKYHDSVICECDRFGVDAKSGLISGCQCKKKLLVVVENLMTTECANGLLSLFGIKSTCIHSRMSAEERVRKLNRFKNGFVPIMFITASEVMPNASYFERVDWLFNLDLPRRIDEYNARIDAVYRAGKPLLVTSFFDKLMDTPLAKDLAEILVNAGQAVPEWLLKEFDIRLENDENGDEESDESLWDKE